MKGITRDCAQEMIERKSIWIYGIVTFLGLLGIFGVKSMAAFGSGQINGQPIGGGIDLPVPYIAGGIDTFLWLLVVFTVFLTAGLVPTMLVRGRAEFYLSKPVSRGYLLVNKLFGVWVVYGATIAAAGLISWLTFAVLFGVTAWGVVWVLVLNLVMLFVWLSIVMFMGIVTNSTGLTIVAAFLVWLFQWLLAKREIAEKLIDSRPLKIILDGLYYILPKPSQISDISGQVAAGNTVASWMPLWSTLLFAVVLIGVAVYVFQRKDY